MNHIEDDLKNALRRKPAPPGLAAKVFERAKDGSVNRNAPRPFITRRFRMMAVAAAIIVAVAAGIFTHSHYITARNEAALQRTLIALSIVSEQFEQAEKKVEILLKNERGEVKSEPFNLEKETEGTKKKEIDNSGKDEDLPF